jgi:hypothetical protein
MKATQINYGAHKGIYLVLILVIFSINSACDKQTLAIVHNLRLYFEDIKLERSISKFEATDELFFEIHHMDRFGDEIIAQNHINQRMYFMDLDMNFKRAILSKGDGPEEFRYAGEAVMYKNEIFTMDYQKRRMVRVNPKGEFISSFRINDWFGKGTILLKNDKIFLHNNVIHGLQVFDFYGNTEGNIHLSRPIEFGKINPFIYIKNLREFILVAFDTFLPYLEVLDVNGNQVSELNMEKLPIFKNAMEKQIENRIKQPMASIVFFNDVKVIGNDIFILINHWDASGQYFSDTILHVAFKNNKLEFIDSFVLKKGNVYKNFVLIPERKKIIAYESVQNQFDIFSYN